MQEIKYKHADLKDIPVIRELAIKTWNQHYPGIISQEQIDYMLENLHSFESLNEQMKKAIEFSIALVNNIPAGFGAISSTDQKNYFLHKLYVLKELKIKGLGTGLFNFIINDKQGMEYLRLQVNRKNYTAINFYFGKGFTIEEVKDFDIGNGFSMDDFVMVKKMK